MLNMFGWLFNKSLSSVLNERKAVKIKGVSFVIKKIDALSFLDGSKVMLQMYDVYNVANQSKENTLVAEKKIRDHLSEVIVAGCAVPSFSHKENIDGTVYVNDLFKDIEMVNMLYEEIIYFTYGKKKLNIYQKKS
jgi:hypothetical protein